MTYSFKTIGDTLYTEMLKIKDTDSRVGWVYNYDVKIEDGVSLPAIIITPSNGWAIPLDSCLYETTIPFTIRLFDRIQDGVEQVEDNMRVVADMMISRLKNIGTITWTNNDGWTVKMDYVYTRGFADTQEPIRVFEIEATFTAVEK